MKEFLSKLFGRVNATNAKKGPESTAPQAQAPEEPRGPIAREPELEKAAPEHEKPWIGVDLDGTLARFGTWHGFEHIGRPIPGMKARVLEWLEQGYRVKIFTARASVPQGVEPIKKWLAENGFPDLEITCVKDFHMLELWDDRAIQVVANSGSPVLSAKYAALPKAPLFGLERTPHGKAAQEEMSKEAAPPAQ